jgi:hypothetical protein
VSSIVWGFMNGNRSNATACKVFVPDPWTFSEDAYPAEYQGLIALPRYLAKNYLDFSKLTAVGKGLDLVRTLLRSTRGGDFIDGLPVLARFPPVRPDQCGLYRVLRISVGNGLHSRRRALSPGRGNRLH